MRFPFSLFHKIEAVEQKLNSAQRQIIRNWMLSIKYKSFDYCFVQFILLCFFTSLSTICQLIHLFVLDNYWWNCFIVTSILHLKNACYFHKSTENNWLVKPEWKKRTSRLKTYLETKHTHTQHTKECFEFEWKKNGAQIGHIAGTLVSQRFQCFELFVNTAECRCVQWNWNHCHHRCSFLFRCRCRCANNIKPSPSCFSSTK